MIRTIISLCFISLFFIQTTSAYTNTEKHFKKIQKDPVALRHFLYQFPKGADLHNHLDGTVYAENLLQWAAQDGKCIDLNRYIITPAPCDNEQQRPQVSDIIYNDAIVNSIIDKFSTRNYKLRSVSGHNQFFSTFGRFITATFGRQGSMLAEASSRAARQNILHLELMQSIGMYNARELAVQTPSITINTPIEKLMSMPEFQAIVKQAIKETDEAEQQWRQELKCSGTNPSSGCNISVRYIAQVIRTFPPEQVLMQTLLAFFLVDSDPRYIGLNFVAPEDHPITLRDHKWQMQTIGKLSAKFTSVKDHITMHAGELAMNLVPPEHLGIHIREAVEIAGAKRIGHGVDIIYEQNPYQLMKKLVERDILVEINLTSNESILGIEGDRHPFKSYWEQGVPLALSTDDEGVSRIDLTHEYERAVRTYQLSYEDLKRLSRNSISYSFLPGENLFSDLNKLKYSNACSKSKPQKTSLNTSCQTFLNNNEKARMQWQLEKRLVEFETSF